MLAKVQSFIKIVILFYSSFSLTEIILSHPPIVIKYDLLYHKIYKQIYAVF